MANPTVPALIEEVTKAVGVMDSATAFINGVPALLSAAIAAALENGATAEELAPLTTLEQELELKHDALVAALAASAPPGERRR
jgi:hypothetical protein